MNGKSYNITSEEELANVLSVIMENAFNRTLIVNNDLVNRNNLSGAIKLARKKALESIMEQQDIYEGCGFLSPEFNIIRSVLSKNGIVSKKRL